MASALVGLTGSVVGVDVTASQLAVARAHQEEWAAEIGWNNLRFVEGRIEALSEAGLSDQSFDLVISNCVVNLSPDKRAVMREAWRVLAWGGEFHFSDVYCDRRLPSELRSHPLLLGECLGGALYVEDMKRLCHEVGFADPRVLSSAPITVGDDALAALLGEARFTSITYRLFKLPTGRLETLCEDYGSMRCTKAPCRTRAARTAWTITTGWRRASRFWCAATLRACWARPGWQNTLRWSAAATRITACFRAALRRRRGRQLWAALAAKRLAATIDSVCAEQPEEALC